MIRNRRKPKRRNHVAAPRGRRKVMSKRSRERRKIEREQERLRKMSLKFGKTIAPNFGRVLENSKRQLTRHPYMNFLRDFKHRHPRYGLTRILREAAKLWKRLAPDVRASYTQQQVLKTLQHGTKLESLLKMVPSYPILFDYNPQSLSARRNIERKLRTRQMTPRHDQGGRERKPVRPHVRRY
ncbi:uncharacterized protein LOC101459550 [Ceratitis capitata]|uniref:uncharacterized protein LOC101459550 n=1 Tax=Ceratitis capitata TaxID=7213 RepID=UPI0006188A83|nr:uncharacterized protein LOC101459550 [Ceratitis capitata]